LDVRLRVIARVNQELPAAAAVMAAIRRRAAVTVIQINDHFDIKKAVAKKAAVFFCLGIKKFYLQNTENVLMW